MQLYSVEQKRSQALEAHAAAFSTIKASCPCSLYSSLACRSSMDDNMLYTAQVLFSALPAGACLAHDLLVSRSRYAARSSYQEGCSRRCMMQYEDMAL